MFSESATSHRSSHIDCSHSQQSGFGTNTAFELVHDASSKQDNIHLNPFCNEAKYTNVLNILKPFFPCKWPLVHSSGVERERRVNALENEAAFLFLDDVCLLFLYNRGLK